MEKYMDIMKKTLELSESCLEALQHIIVRLNEGAFEDTIGLMDDFINGFYQMDTSIQGFIAELPSNQMEKTTNQLRSDIKQTVTSYEQGESNKIIECVQSSLLPSYKAWKAELEQALPNVVS
jgi:hypothetical protein